jgi:hypothetical protein
MKDVYHFYIAQLVIIIHNEFSSAYLYDDIEFSIYQIIDPLPESDLLMKRDINTSKELLIKKDKCTPVDFVN